MKSLLKLLLKKIFALRHFTRERLRGALSCPLPVLIALLATLFVLTFAGLQTLRFHRLTDALFYEELAGDSLSAHYILAYPEKYGLPADHAALPVYSGEAQKESLRRLDKYEKAARSIRPAFLSGKSRLLLSLLTEYLEAQQKEAAFTCYAEPLSPSSGVQSSLPILLAEYTFRSRQDVENYLSLLSQIPDYLDGIASYEKEKADAGLFMADFSADKVIDQCYQIMDAGLLRNDAHFLNTTFTERLQPLVSRGLLTAGEASAYERQNHNILLQLVMPAYETLGDELLLLKGSGANEEGLAHFPDGKSYYTCLLESATGCSRPLEEIRQLLTDRITQDTGKLAALLRQSPDILSLSPKDIFPQEKPEVYLKDLQKRIACDFPAFPQSGASPSHTVKTVSKSLEDYCSPAFYLTPPIDDITENTIYINTKDSPGGLELYTTLAHEGYPGHLYQTVYYQLYQQEKSLSPARNLLNYGGYSEGWALYVEMLSYEYGKELMRESGVSADAPELTDSLALTNASAHSDTLTLADSLALVDALRLNRSIQLGLYSLLDLRIHYDGAGYEEIYALLCHFGITDPDTAQSIYEYIVEEPANYPKYYVGYLEFEMLKETAKKVWGDKYSDMRFHKLMLEMGPCPFAVLWEKLA